MRVTMIVKRFAPGDVIGGAEAFAWRIARQLVARGVKVDILSARCRRSWKPLEWVPADDGLVRVRRLPHPSVRILGTGLYSIGLVVALIRSRSDYDAVFVTFAGLDAVAARLAALVTQRPVVCKIAASSDRGDLGQIRARWHARLTLRILRGVDRYVALNDQVIEELSSIGVPADRIVPLPNGIDVDHFCHAAPEERAVLRRRIGLPEHALVLIGAGRLSLQKNWPTLFHALATLSDIPRWHCVLLGKGAEQDTLVALAKRLHLNDRITIIAVDDVRPYLRASDIFVLPSLWEGLSNALLEAQACGLPCVCSDVPGNRDVIRYGVNGFLFPCGDSGALARRLRLLAGDAEARSRMGSEARNRMIEAFSIDRIADQYVKVLADVSGAAPAPETRPVEHPVEAPAEEEICAP